MAIDTKQPGGNKDDGAAALAGAPSAVRREQQFSPVALDETDDAELNDISTILLGSKAITGKAVTAAGQAGRTVDSVEAHKLADEKKRSDEEQAYRERMNLAAWNAQKTNVGGVEMTNAEAQAARQHIIDNEDYFADRAVREGRINASEAEEYKRTARRIKELEDLKGRGIATDADKRESEQLLHSKMGEAVEHDAGKEYADARGYGAKVTTSPEQTASALQSNNSKPFDDKLFKNAPELGEHFDAAKSATSPLDRPSTDIQPSRKLAAMNFAP